MVVGRQKWTQDVAWPGPGDWHRTDAHLEPDGSQERPDGLKANFRILEYPFVFPPVSLGTGIQHPSLVLAYGLGSFLS